MEEISLSELWDGIRKRMGKIILTAVVLALVTFVLSKFVIRPKYEAEATLIIGKPQDYKSDQSNLQYNDLMLNQKLVSTYSEIIKSKRIADQVIDNLELGFTLEEYKDRVTVGSVKDTEVISINVIDTIPERAMDIANETAEIFQKDVKEIMHIDNVDILDEAALPEKPVSPIVKRNTALAAILGLFIGAFVAIVIEINDTSIKSAQEIQDKFGLPVLGVVPEIKEK